MGALGSLRVSLTLFDWQILRSYKYPLGIFSESLFFSLDAFDVIATLRSEVFFFRLAVYEWSFYATKHKIKRQRNIYTN